MQSIIALFSTGNLDLYWLDLSNNLFTGYIPPEIGLLTDLHYLFISFNSLQGSIPSNIGLLTDLLTLDISFCGITGSIPKEIFNAQSNLKELWLTGNSITNKIPTEIVLVTNLRYVELSNNFLSGTMPDFSLMSKLQILNLRNNRLTGLVQNLTLSSQNLNTIILADNSLTGSFFNILGNAVFPKLVSIDVSRTMMTGTLPNFDLIPKLEIFVAASNCLGGSIPWSLCSAKGLKSLILDGIVSGAKCVSYIYEDRKNNIMGFNGVTNKRAVPGSIPECIFSLSSLETLHFSGNGLTGSLPNSISTSIQRLSASFNRLHGSLPDGLLQLALVELDLSHNKIDGTIKRNNWDAEGFLSLKNNR